MNREAYHGFLNLEIANDGKRLVGSFDTNDGKIIDIIILFLILENLILHFNYN